MTLNELTALLAQNPDKRLRISLPGGGEVPQSFHITEVGHVTKRFVDCGGHVHVAESCQLQAWVGDDGEHRLEAGKLAQIFRKAAALEVLPEGARSLPVEIEYENGTVSQYAVGDHYIADGGIVLRLEAKHTDCLAKAECGLPATPATACCGGKC